MSPLNGGSTRDAENGCPCHGILDRLHAAEVAEIRAAVVLGIGVQHLDPAAADRQPQAIAHPRHRRQVEHDDRDLIRTPPDPRVDRRLDVGCVDPGEAIGLVVGRPQCRGGEVDAAEVLDEVRDAGVHRFVEEVPRQGAVVRPLVPGRDLRAHEQELLARLPPHAQQQRAQVGEALPLVAGHLAQQRALAVDDLVVGERHDEVLGRRVQAAERQPVVVEAAVNRVLGEVLERVVHPAHVPLEAEADAAQVCRTRDAGEGGRLLRDRHDPGKATVDALVHLTQEGDGLEVLAPAVDVRRPLAGLARVVEVEHRGDGVDPQPVDVVALAPEQRVGDEEVAHLGASEVEDQRAPVGMLAALGVGVLVQCRAVESAQGEVVGREVGRHPVDDHPDPRVVEHVDHRGEVVRRSEARRRRVVAGDLVAPRAVERVLGHRQQLNVGEPERPAVRDELLGSLPVAQPRAVVVAHPGAEVDLVGRHR